MPTDGSANAALAREPSADLYRVFAVFVVVIGHWLVSAVTYRDGQFGNDYPLDVLPWTRWLTLVFQVVPVFFLIGGYANATSWTRWCESRNGHWLSWARHRLAMIVGPTTVYVVLAFAGMAVLAEVGIAPAALSFGGWAIAMHLWFVPIYLVVVTLTPVAVSAHRRWGLLVPTVLAVAVVAVDVAARIADLPAIEPANYLLCWAAIYQIGIGWRGGAFGGRRPWLIAAAGAIVLTTLLGLHCYPVSMIGSPGAAEQNNFPPTAALLAYASIQAALLIAMAPTVTRWMRGARCQRLLAVANNNVMAVYLWQMIPVIVVALIGYPTGLLPRPEPGTGGWWLFRLVWLMILALVMTAQVVLLWLGRSMFNRPLPAIVTPLPRWSAPGLLMVGIAMATLVLWRLAVDGFAPQGRFPVSSAVRYLAAVALLSLAPARHHTETTAAQPNTPGHQRRAG